MTTYTAPPGGGNIHGNPGGGINIDPGLGPVQNPDVTVPTSAQLRNDLINMGNGHSDLHINGGNGRVDLDQNPGALLGGQLTNEPHQSTNVVGIQHHPEYPAV
jgi:hypothetical protein